MGLFDSLFMAKDIIASGINAVKASGRLEELVGQTIDYYDNVLSDENREFYKAYKELKAKQEAIEDLDERNAVGEEVEKAMVAYLVSVSANTAVSEKFRSDVRDAVAEWKKSNNSAAEIVEKYMMKEAKTEEEREEVRKALQEIAEDDE